MSHAKRADWLLERRERWCGLSRGEVVLEECSPRVVDLVIEMREADLFPSYLSEEEVLFAFLGSVAEARERHRARYSAAVRATDAHDVPMISGRAGALRHTRAYLR